MSRRLKLKVGKESMIGYGIVLSMSYSSYSTLVYSLLGQTSTIRSILIAIVLLVDFIAISKNQSQLKKLFNIIAVFTVLYGYTYVVFPANRSYIAGAIEDSFKFILLAFLLSVGSDETLYKSLKNSAFVILACAMFEPFTQYVTSGHDGYMVYGMRLLMTSALLGYYYHKEKKNSYLIFYIISVALILIWGNRSALMISGICFITQMLMQEEKKKRTIRYLQISLIILLVLMLLSGDLLSGFSNLLQRMGLSSRTISLIQLGFEKATDNNGRSIIWANGLRAISAKPIIGYGIGGDRNLCLLGQAYFLAGKYVYVHNFVLELLLDFGVIIGSAFVVLLLSFSLKIIKSKRGFLSKELFVVICLAAVMKLSFSSTIWTDVDAYICLGVGLHCLKEIKLQTLRVQGKRQTG